MSQLHDAWLEHRRLRWLIADLKLDLALRRFARKYSPDQPRVPAGNADGGQWTSGGSANDDHLAQSSTTAPDQPSRSDLSQLQEITNDPVIRFRIDEEECVQSAWNVSAGAWFLDFQKRGHGRALHSSICKPRFCRQHNTRPDAERCDSVLPYSPAEVRFWWYSRTKPIGRRFCCRCRSTGAPSFAQRNVLFWSVIQDMETTLKSRK